MLASRSIVPMPLNQRVSGETKGRKITRHGFPDLLQIHTQVIMNQNISHAGDGLPRSGRFGLAKIRRQILHGFADHDQVTDWGCPDSVDSDQGHTRVSVRVVMYCCS